jgi:hypothetical protein
MDNVVMELPNEAIMRMTPPEIPGRADHDCRKIVAQQGGATSSTRHSLQRRRPTEIDRAMLVDEDRPAARVSDEIQRLRGEMPESSALRAENKNGGIQ